MHALVAAADAATQRVMPGDHRIQRGLERSRVERAIECDADRFVEGAGGVLAHLRRCQNFDLWLGERRRGDVSRYGDGHRSAGTALPAKDATGLERIE